MYKGEDVILGILARKKTATIEQLSSESGLNADSVRRIVESLKSSGHANVIAEEKIRGIPTEEFAGYVRNGFPELLVYKKAQTGASISDLDPAEKSIGIRWAKVNGLIDIEGGRLVARKTPEEAEAHRKVLVQAFDLLSKGADFDPVVVETLFERRLLGKKSVKTITVSYTGKPFDTGMEHFDLNVPSKNAPMGKSHPITKMTMKIRSIMAELGFQEMEGDIIESSFWNFDALFQPQDHPARELADTFYIDGTVPLPGDKALVEKVKKAHEDGWKYKWDPREASRQVLRTHTTCLSARYLASIKDRKPRKYFAIGRVFRNEATDYKHLAEFHQVEGIIAWEKATFTDLLGVLKEFYRKLGFEKIRFRPSFFPYTEPSLEIEVYFEKRKQWLELGGAGIFRPEVSVPLAGIYPVLAWGLSLERPLMLLLELEDIRDFYKNDVDFLNSRRLDI
jgi:phenylalanyl-tRNA synthetase alpha chain